MSVLFYRRPTYIVSEKGYLNAQSCQRHVERVAASNTTSPIPAELSFEAILDNKTLPPCTLGDFMDYLMYVAHDVENLQFFLWFRDYCARWEALSDSEKALSPEWKGSTAGIIEATGGQWPLSSPVASSQASLSRAGTADSRYSLHEYVTALPSVAEKGITGSGHEDDYKIFVDKSVASQKKRTSTKQDAQRINADAGVGWSGCEYHSKLARTPEISILISCKSPSSPSALSSPASSHTTWLLAHHVT